MRSFLIKAFIVIVLAAAIFGAAGYWAYELFVRPDKALQAERAKGPQAPPPDPTLPEFDKCMEVVKKGDILASRAALAGFVEHYPKSSKVEEAKKAVDYYRKTQAKDGSWTQVSRGEVGPIYQTSIAVIVLSVPANYLPIFQR